MKKQSPSSVTPVTSAIPYTAICEGNKFFNYLRTLDANANSIHDIYTKFTIPDIYKIMSSSAGYSTLMNPVSKVIQFEAEIIDDMCIRISELILSPE
jgi:hypothetical protein